MKNGKHARRARTAERAPIYNKFAGFYDAIFERVFSPRIEFALQLMQLSPGDRILDLGCGTGLSVQHFPADVEVVAVDLASSMLTEAKSKSDQFQGRKIHFARMDALNLGFADHSFDAVFVSFVVSVVRDPVQVIREIERVAKPGARILVINHFRSQQPIIGSIENLFNPFFVRLGWRTDLRIEELMAGSRLEIQDIRKKRRADLWTAILARNPLNGNGNGNGHPAANGNGHRRPSEVGASVNQPRATV